MPPSRRDFLTSSSMGLVGMAVAAREGESQTPPASLPAGSPPAFGTSAPVGPAVSTETFAQAEKLVQIEMKQKDLAQAAGNWQQSLASVYERRTGPKKIAIEDAVAPATVWNPT